MASISVLVNGLFIFSVSSYFSRRRWYLSKSLSSSSQLCIWLTVVPYCCCCSTAKSCLTLCSPIACSMPGSSVLRYLLEFAPIRAVPTSGLLWSFWIEPNFKDVWCGPNVLCMFQTGLIFLQGNNSEHSKDFPI